MGGLLPAVIVLETLHQLGTRHRCRRVGYATSADVAGDKSRVVGYAGMRCGERAISLPRRFTLELVPADLPLAKGWKRGPLGEALWREALEVHAQDAGRPVCVRATKKRIRRQAPPIRRSGECALIEGP